MIHAASDMDSSLVDRAGIDMVSTATPPDRLAWILSVVPEICSTARRTLVGSARSDLMSMVSEQRCEVPVSLRDGQRATLRGTGLIADSQVEVSAGQGAEPLQPHARVR